MWTPEEIIELLVSGFQKVERSSRRSFEIFFIFELNGNIQPIYYYINNVKV